MATDNGLNRSHTPHRPSPKVENRDGETVIAGVSTSRGSIATVADAPQQTEVSGEKLEAIQGKFNLKMTTSSIHAFERLFKVTPDQLKNMSFQVLRPTIERELAALNSQQPMNIQDIPALLARNGLEGKDLSCVFVMICDIYGVSRKNSLAVIQPKKPQQKKVRPEGSTITKDAPRPQQRHRQPDGVQQEAAPPIVTVEVEPPKGGMGKGTIGGIAGGVAVGLTALVIAANSGSDDDPKKENEGETELVKGNNGDLDKQLEKKGLGSGEQQTGNNGKPTRQIKPGAPTPEVKKDDGTKKDKTTTGDGQPDKSTKPDPKKKLASELSGVKDVDVDPDDLKSDEPDVAGKPVKPPVKPEKPAEVDVEKEIAEKKETLKELYADLYGARNKSTEDMAKWMGKLKSIAECKVAGVEETTKAAAYQLMLEQRVSLGHINIVLKPNEKYDPSNKLELVKQSAIVAVGKYLTKDNFEAAKKLAERASLGPAAQEAVYKLIIEKYKDNPGKLKELSDGCKDLASVKILLLDAEIEIAKESGDYIRMKEVMKERGLSQEAILKRISAFIPQEQAELVAEASKLREEGTKESGATRYTRKRTRFITFVEDHTRELGRFNQKNGVKDPYGQSQGLTKNLNDDYSEKGLLLEKKGNGDKRVERLKEEMDNRAYLADPDNRTKDRLEYQAKADKMGEADFRTTVREAEVSMKAAKGQPNEAELVKAAYQEVDDKIAAILEYLPHGSGGAAKCAAKYQAAKAQYNADTGKGAKGLIEWAELVLLKAKDWQVGDSNSAKCFKYLAKQTLNELGTNEKVAGTDRVDLQDLAKDLAKKGITVEGVKAEKVDVPVKTPSVLKASKEAYDLHKLGIIKPGQKLDGTGDWQVQKDGSIVGKQRGNEPVPTGELPLEVSKDAAYTLEFDLTRKDNGKGDFLGARLSAGGGAIGAVADGYDSLGGPDVKSVPFHKNQKAFRKNIASGETVRCKVTVEPFTKKVGRGRIRMCKFTWVVGDQQYGPEDIPMAQMRIHEDTMTAHPHQIALMLYAGNNIKPGGRKPTVGEYSNFKLTVHRGTIRVVPPRK